MQLFIKRNLSICYKTCVNTSLFESSWPSESSKMTYFTNFDSRNNFYIFSYCIELCKKGKVKHEMKNHIQFF